MTHPFSPTLAALAVACALAAAPAVASASSYQDHCQAGPRDQWRPMADLEKQLSSQGWRIEKIEVDDGCYEVEAIDKDGWKVEAYFHPTTLQRVTPKRHGH